MRRKNNAIGTGDLRPIESRILEQVANFAGRGEREVHGYALADAIWNSPVDAFRFPPSTLYRAMRRMEDAGLLVSRWEDAAVANEDGRPPRRLYSITGMGMAILKSQQQPELLLSPQLEAN